VLVHTALDLSPDDLARLPIPLLLAYVIERLQGEGEGVLARGEGGGRGCNMQHVIICVFRVVALFVTDDEFIIFFAFQTCVCI
jgi:hypothetical protein